MSGLTIRIAVGFVGLCLAPLAVLVLGSLGGGGGDGQQ